MKKLLGEGNLRKGGIAEEIAILKQRREARKLKEDKKNNPQPAGSNNIKDGSVQFQKMVNKRKEEVYSQNKPLIHETSENSKIFVVVRKRPFLPKEENSGEVDCVSIINPRVYIHECKIQIDGFTKYLEDHEFFFDNAFGENDDTMDVYNCTIAPLINLILNQGIVTCFAYGQTGSGKTYTMKGIESQAIDELYSTSQKMGDKFDFYISFFEIYSGRVYDLLNNRTKLQVLDDKNGKVQVYGLIEQLSETREMMHRIIDAANAIRTTHNTVTNETSSRSHAICNIIIKKKGDDEEWGKLSLVDLAGSERAQETKSNNRQRRAEGAEINKSLLALKECIRALEEKKSGSPDTHVPFRASKLTHVLRDSFVSKSDKSKIIMISCVSPSYNSANHSINTLRYSDRLKEKTKKHFGGNYNNMNFAARNMNSKEIDYNANKDQSGSNNNINNNFKNINCLNNSNSNGTNLGYNNMNRSPAISQNKLQDKNYKEKKQIYPPINQNKKPYQEVKKPDNFKNYNINSYNIQNDGEEDDWNYLKKTMAKRDGKVINDDYIKYHKLTDKLIEEEDEIITNHMNIIKEDAKLLTKEGDLITNIKGVGTEEDFKMDEYISGLEKVVTRKLKIYTEILDKINLYKNHIREEDDLRKKLGPDDCLFGGD